MNIQENWLKFKGFLQNSEVALVGLIIAVSLGSFLLGRLSALDMARSDSQGAAVTLTEAQEPIPAGEGSERITAATTTVSEGKGTTSTQNPNSAQPSEVLTATSYVASKTGTKYHLPWCSGAARIKEENKVWFTSKADAEAAGYEPALNCKGI